MVDGQTRGLVDSSRLVQVIAMKSRLVPDSLGRGDDLEFWCPGCGELHRIPATGDWQPHRPVWGFNGDTDRPTLTPSILRRIGPFPDGHTEVCHSFLRDGRLEFLSDCTHELKGQTVDLPELPDDPWSKSPQ